MPTHAATQPRVQHEGHLVTSTSIPYQAALNSVRNGGWLEAACADRRSTIVRLCCHRPAPHMPARARRTHTPVKIITAADAARHPQPIASTAEVVDGHGQSRAQLTWRHDGPLHERAAISSGRSCGERSAESAHSAFWACGIRISICSPQGAHGHSMHSHPFSPPREPP